jgi:hypothetical protein
MDDWEKKGAGRSSHGLEQDAPATFPPASGLLIDAHGDVALGLLNDDLAFEAGVSFYDEGFSV